GRIRGRPATPLGRRSQPLRLPDGDLPRSPPEHTTRVGAQSRAPVVVCAEVCGCAPTGTARGARSHPQEVLSVSDHGEPSSAPTVRGRGAWWYVAVLAVLIVAVILAAVLFFG